jgi:hypothetical protein
VILSLCFGDLPERPPLPESLLTESATDVDAAQAGEIEFEANLVAVGARSGGTHAMVASVEAEWRVLRDVGLRLEPSYAWVVHRSGRSEFGVSGAIALGVLHDLRQDVHAQVELLGRTAESVDSTILSPEETVLPYALDFVGAARRGRWTLRATIGVEAGGHFEYAPVHTDAALLTPFLSDDRFGFFGVEVRADWARKTPLVIAPDFVAFTTPLGLPFSVSLALPVNIGAGATTASFGFFARLMWMADREAAHGRAF